MERAVSAQAFRQEKDSPAGKNETGAGHDEAAPRLFFADECPGGSGSGSGDGCGGKALSLHGRQKSARGQRSAENAAPCRAGFLPFVRWQPAVRAAVLEVFAALLLRSFTGLCCSHGAPVPFLLRLCRFRGAPSRRGAVAGAVAVPAAPKWLSLRHFPSKKLQ